MRRNQFGSGAGRPDNGAGKALASFYRTMRISSSPSEFRIGLLGAVGCESVLLIEAPSTCVLVGHPQLSGPLAKSVIKESLTDTLPISRWTRRKARTAAISDRLPPQVLARRTARDKPHKSAFAPGETDPLSGMLL